MMQSDVKSAHVMAGSSGVVFAGRTRLKGAVVSNTQSGTPANILFCNNVALSATYSITTTTVTVTVAAGHGLATGARVFLDYTSGNGTDNLYTITVTGVTTFTGTLLVMSISIKACAYTDTLPVPEEDGTVAVNVVTPVTVIV